MQETCKAAPFLKSTLLKSWSFGLATLAALGLAAGHPAQAQTTFTYSGTATTTPIDVPPNNSGDPDSLTITPGSGQVTLTAGRHQTVAVGTDDFHVGYDANYPSDPTGVATFDFTLNGQTKTVTEAVGQGYSDNIGAATDTITLANAGPVWFNFGSQGNVGVTFFGAAFTGGVDANGSTPIEADFVLAPEPSSVAAFAFTGLGAAGLMLRARKRA